MEKQKQRPRSSKSDYNEYWRKAEDRSRSFSGGRRLGSSSAAVRTTDDGNPSQSRDHEKPSPEVAVNSDGIHHRGSATKDSKSRRQMAAEESRDQASAHSAGNVGRGGEAAGSRGRHSVRPYFEPMRRAYWMDEYKMEDNYYMYSLAKIYDVTPMKRQKERQYWNILQHLGYHHDSCPQWNGYERYLSRPRTTEHRRVNPKESSQGNHRSISTMTSASAADGKSAKSTTEENRQETSSGKTQQRRHRDRTRQSRGNEDRDRDREEEEKKSETNRSSDGERSSEADED